MYFPATYTFFPVWNVPRLVVTMHDTLALAHPDLVFPTRGGRLAWLLKEHAAARMSDRIVTVSGDVPARPSGLVSPARKQTPRHHRGSRLDLPAGGRESSGRDSLAETRDSFRRQVPALRWRTEPTQEPASPDRGVFADQGHELAAGRGWRLQGRFPHPCRGDPVGHRLGRPERSSAPARLRA